MTSGNNITKLDNDDSKYNPGDFKKVVSPFNFITSTTCMLEFKLK